jgi:hypothetical protein
MLNATLGVRVHSGWAAVVAVSEAAEVPQVVLRTRLDLQAPGIAGSKQPYHTAERMQLSHAKSFLDRCANEARTLAVLGLRNLLADANSRGCTVASCAIVLASGRLPPDLAAVLASHALIHTAEGEFYRDAVRLACESCGLAVSGMREKDLLSRGMEMLGINSAELQKRLSSLGKLVGAPWTQDEKLSALAAWLAIRSSR